MTEYFTVYEPETKHEVGNSECEKCYQDTYSCECGGLVHNDLIDYDGDSFSFRYKCDKCNSEEIPY